MGRESGPVSSWVKTLVVLALVVPMTAYVAGSLVASRSYDPSDRRPVIIQDAPPASTTGSRAPDTTAPSSTGRPTGRPPGGTTSPQAPSSRPAPTRAPTGRGPGQPSPSGTVDDDDATVVLPPPTSVDDSGDDDDDEGDEGDEGDDDDDGAEDDEGDEGDDD